jgi:hypothetical protein
VVHQGVQVEEADREGVQAEKVDHEGVQVERVDHEGVQEAAVAHQEEEQRVVEVVNQPGGPNLEGAVRSRLDSREEAL